MKKILLSIISCFVIIFGFGIRAFAENEVEAQWIMKNDLPTQLAGSAVAEANGRIYVFGGISSSLTDTKKTVYEYDPINDSWDKKNDMPFATTASTASTVDGKIYLFGGYTGNAYTMTGGSVLDSVYVYDPQKDTWVKRQNMSTGKAWASSVAYEDAIYIVGGIINTNATTVATVEVYNSKTDTWTTRASMPSALHAVGLTVLNDKIYAVGGGNGITSYKNVREYDPKTDIWTDKANLLNAKDGSGTVVLNGMIYSIGGGATSGESLRDVEVYNPITNIWETAPNLNVARTAFGSAVMNGKIYVVGGLIFNPSTITKTVEEFTPTSLPTEPNPTPEPEPTGDRAILTITLTTGLEKEFDLSMKEVNDFISWYEGKQAGSGSASYAINKHDNNKGPFSSRKDYMLFDRILTFEVSEYTK
ncbi:kelch-like protein [Paenibacillus polymyxa]|uniref:Kelch repeat-containing protein n=1 Tax=Paenibacillus polymyxa TaxID=1406 RepID=UPI000908430B|nr:kelch motif-containing protein [Paenibacillus polymyxa]APB70892.1 kelch-like protein [Paenibacillus polymyxa]